MHKATLLEIETRQLITLAKSLTPDNCKDLLPQLQKHLQIIELSCSLPYAEAGQDTVDDKSETTTLHKTYMYETPSPIFEDKTILIVGAKGKSTINRLKKEIEQRKGQCIFCEGQETKATFKTRIKKSDVIIGLTNQIPEPAVNYIKEFSSAFLVPYSFVATLDTDVFISCVQSLLKRKVELQKQALLNLNAPFS